MTEKTKKMFIGSYTFTSCNKQNKKLNPIREKLTEHLNCLYFTVVLCSLQCLLPFFYRQGCCFIFSHMKIFWNTRLDSHLTLFFVPSLITYVCRSLYRKDTFNQSWCVFGVVFFREIVCRRITALLLVVVFFNVFRRESKLK